jgi:hypothetical protein
MKGTRKLAPHLNIRYNEKGHIMNGRIIQEKIIDGFKTMEAK